MYKRNFTKRVKSINFFNRRRNIGSLPRIFISSILLITFFYAMPIVVNFANNKNMAFQNKSKAVLAYTLKNGTSGNEINDKILNEQDLLVDIFSLNDLETDTVRLNASTIKQLFEDTNYTLKDVRKTKLVKPVALTLLPNEIKMIKKIAPKLKCYTPGIRQNKKKNDQKRTFNTKNPRIIEFIIYYNILF